MIDEGKPFDISYFDFGKASDSVPHKRISTELNVHGISGKLLGWISAFLTGRTQKVLSCLLFFRIIMKHERPDFGKVIGICAHMSGHVR